MRHVPVVQEPRTRRSPRLPSVSPSAQTGPGPATHPHDMNSNKSIRCTIGRHHWQPTTVAGMHERICVDCGRPRFDASIHPDHETRGGGVSAPGLAPAAFLSDGGFGGGGFGDGGFA